LLAPSAVRQPRAVALRAAISPRLMGAAGLPMV